MRQKSGPVKMPAEQVVKDIRRGTRRQGATIAEITKHIGLSKATVYRALSTG